MKYLLLLLGAFYSLHLVANDGNFQCLTNEDRKSANCKLSYDLLSRIAVAKDRKQVPTDISISQMEKTLRSGKMTLPQNFNELPIDAKRKILFRNMTNSENLPELQATGDIDLKQTTFQSGTRGGGIDLPENLWIWF